MTTPQQAAAPASGTPTPAPTFAELAADPEIAALLEFTPVVRSHPKANGWTADMQRMFIAWLAHYGSPTKACDELGKARSGIDKVYKAETAEEFRASWDGAIALAERRRIAGLAARPAGAGAMRAPVMSRGKPQRTDLDWEGNAPLPGQVLNENGLWEDEENYRRRAEEAKDSISNKLRNARRLYLMSISNCAGKRAAFEMLTELPIDWDLAAELKAQPDEPWRKPNMREPDMLLTAENGWMGDFAHGPDKKAELRRQLNAWRVENGKEPIDWDESSE